MNQRAGAVTFRSRLQDQGSGMVEMEWHGHVDLDGLRASCAELERKVQRLECFVLLVDATGVTGYDPDAYAFARRWALTDVASRASAVAVVVESQLGALESPATALVPPRRLKLFGSRGAARAYLMQRVAALVPAPTAVSDARRLGG